MNELTFKQQLTKEEIEKQPNEWLLNKYVWMQRELGGIVTEEKENVKQEILRRMAQ